MNQQQKGGTKIRRAKKVFKCSKLGHFKGLGKGSCMDFLKLPFSVLVFPPEEADFKYRKMRDFKKAEARA